MPRPKRVHTTKLSQAALTTLLDLIEIKMQSMEVFDREDAREAKSLSEAREEIAAILGVTVDVDSAVSIQDERVEPPQALTPVQFFNAIDNGTPVQVQSGTYNTGSNSITDGQIEIED